MVTVNCATCLSYPGETRLCLVDCNDWSAWEPRATGVTSTDRRINKDAVGTPGAVEQVYSQHGPSLPEGDQERLEFPMFDGLLAYFPNAMAETARLSHKATQQHHPDKPMHWDRSKSRDHRNKIVRHLADTHTVDAKGNDHWAMVCWRALAGYQEFLEARDGLPPSPASRNRPEPFTMASLA